MAREAASENLQEFGAAMLVRTTDLYRADAHQWLSRAAAMPVNSWERERLTTAAKLNYNLARQIDLRNSACAGKRSQSPACASGSTTEETPASVSGESQASRSDQT